MNAFCYNYKKNTIKDVTIRRTPKKEDTGIFYCIVCGYKYSRKLSNKDIYKADKTILWGKLWHDKLEEYVKEGNYSTYELSQLMGCSHDTILRKLKGERQELNCKEVYLNLYKKQIIELIQLNPNITRRELHGKLQHKKFNLLKKYDPDWLDENLPKCKKTRYHIDQTKNWEEQDQTLLGILKEKYTEIINQDNVVKITKKLLREKIDEIPMNHYSLKKMPLSSDYVKSIIDDHRSYSVKLYKKMIKKKYYNNNDINILDIFDNFHKFTKYKKDKSVIKELEDYIEELKNKNQTL